MPFSFRFLEPAGITFWILVAALAVLAIRLYRRTEPRLESRIRAGLMALRFLSIALLAFLLLHPVLSHLLARRVPPRIPVLFDASLSMTIPYADSTSAPPQSGTEAPTRFDRLMSVLEEGRTNVVKKIGDVGKVETYRFGEQLRRIEPTQLRAGIQPSEDRTDLARALSDARKQDARTTGAIVLFSDGAHNVGEDPREAARKLGVPVVTVGVGTDGPVSDVSVYEVAASSVAYLDNEVPVVAKLRARGDAVRSLPVYFSEGDKILDSARVDLPGGGVEREVKLKYTPKREGLRRYRVWTPPSSDEISPDNNEHVFAVRILKEKIKVLLVAGQPTFEMTFLKRALESDVSLEVTPTILSLREFPGRLGGKAAGFPESAAKLAKYDLVVLSDVRQEDLSNAQSSMIASYVEDRGGALFVIGGSRSFAFEGSPLREALPAVASPRPIQGTILPRLTDVGAAHPVTRLESDKDANRAIWEGLPPLHEAPSFSSRNPRARVLLRGEETGRDREIALLVALEQRRGRVLALGGGPYWRWDLYPWGQGRSGDPYRKLMTRSVRWLVARDELKQVMIRPAKPLFGGAEPVVIEGQVYDDSYRPIDNVDVRVTIKGPLRTPEEKTREVSLIDLGQGRSEAKIPGLPPGDYEVLGKAQREGTLLGEDRAEMTVTPYRMELEDPAPNFEMLREIARASGGTFLRLDQAGEIANALKIGPIIDRSTRESPLRESPWTFAALLGLLGSEWALRKRRGLP
jgi:hypothetical protein